MVRYLLIAIGAVLGLAVLLSPNWPALALRNFLFLVVVLAHWLLRLQPPH